MEAKIGGEISMVDTENRYNRKCLPMNKVAT